MRNEWIACVTCTCLLLCSRMACAFELPAMCTGASAPADNATPLADLRKRVEEKSETDPDAAVAILCMAIPRVARERGEQSVDLAWWAGALTMPMIAYRNQFAEAIPLLEFSQPILEREYGVQSAEVADIHVAYGWIYQRLGRNAESAVAWERALQIREKFPGEKQIELQKVLVGLALVRLYLGEFPAARVALQRAHDVLAANDALVSEAAAAIENVFTNLAFREENFADAKAHAERQIEIERKLQAGIGQFVPAYVFLGQILERMDDFAGSEAASREAIRLSESDNGPLQRHQFTALTQLGALLDARGRPNEALEFAQRAVDVGERTLGPDAPRLVRALQSLADTERALGRLSEAWHLYERVGRIVEKSRSDIELPLLVTYYRGFAGLLLDLGNVDDAVVALNAGLEAAAAEPALALQRAYLMATLAQASGQHDTRASRLEYGEALQLFQSRLPQTHRTILKVVNELCGLDISDGSSAATSHCIDARSRLASSREIDPALRAAVYANLSELSQSQGNLEQAATHAVSAVSAAEGLGTPDPLWRAYFRAARVLRAQDRAALAIFFGKRAIAQIERERQSFSGEDERLDRGFLRDKIDVYRSVADWLMEVGRFDEGLEVLQLLKAQELYDFVSRNAAWRSSVNGPALDELENALTEKYSASLPGNASAGAEIDRLTRLQARGRITNAERKKLETLLKSASQGELSRARRIRRFIANNSTTGEQGRTSARIDAASLRSIVQSAPVGSAVAVYLLTDKRLRVLIATRRTQTELLIPVDAAVLQRDIGRFLEAITKREPIQEPARKLYETLARPLDEIARRENLDRLVLWLDGPLRYVPFSALQSASGYLGERYAIETLARGVAPLAPAAAPGAGMAAPTVRGFGVTQAIAGYEPLPGMADELCYVVRGPITGLLAQPGACATGSRGVGALSGEGFADAAFTASRFRESLEPPHAYSVLHVGTHFSLRPGSAVRSYLVLGDGSRLMLDALSTYDFSGLELVTLSACQTAMGGGRGDDGREVDGLSSIVQHRGAHQVVASLWRVEDASTAQLMRAMYGALASSPSDVATALKQAEQSVRAFERNGSHPYEHPYYWAGFVVSGTTP